MLGVQIAETDFVAPGSMLAVVTSAFWVRPSRSWVTTFVSLVVPVFLTFATARNLPPDVFVTARPVTAALVTVESYFANSVRPPFCRAMVA